MAEVDHDDRMRLDDLFGPRTSRWLPWAATAAALALLMAGVWFFLHEGRAKSDQWASIGGYVLAYLVAVAALLRWLFHRTGGGGSGWESTADALDQHHLLLVLKSKIGAQLVRPHACDVQGPLDYAPARAIVSRTGLATSLQVMYPREFVGATGYVAPGRYRVTWFHADERGRWREVLRAEHDVKVSVDTPTA